MSTKQISGQVEVKEEIVNQKQPEKSPDIQSLKTKTHTTSYGDNLWNIAFSDYGDGYLWPIILEANKNKIENPDFLKEKIDLIHAHSKNEHHQHVLHNYLFSHSQHAAIFVHINFFCFFRERICRTCFFIFTFIFLIIVFY